VTTAREWLDAAKARSDAFPDTTHYTDAVMAKTDVPALVAALTAVLDTETVEAMAREMAAWDFEVIGPDCPHNVNEDQVCHDCLAARAHDVLRARIDAALGTVTP